MAAIITDDFRKNLADRLIEEIADTAGSSPNYYIGIGKSDPWTDAAADETVAGFAPSVPDGSIREKEEVKENLIGLVEVSRHSRVIPRIEYQQGLIYKRYDVSDPTCFIPTVSGNDTLQPCYAVYEDKIYVCLRNKTNESNVNGQATTGNDEPQVGAGNAYDLAGGASGANYLWAYVADVIPSSTGFNTTQFIEVSTSNISAASTANETTGIIYGIKLLSGGTGYSGTPTVKIIGNNADIGGTNGGTALDVTISGGVITNIDIGSDGDANGILGLDWTEASLVITDNTGSGAEGVVLIGPENGFGYNVAKDLPSYYIGLEASLEGNLEGDAPVIPYRQVSLLRGTEADVRTDDDDSPQGGTYTDTETLDTLKYLQLSSTVTGGESVATGDILSVAITSEESARAFVDYVDTVNDRIYYHQNNNDKINRKAFPASGTAEILDRENESTVHVDQAYSSVGSSEYTRKAGEIIFYENRIQITRSAQQTEDVKLVIQL
jgi:hypothetical protein